MEAVERRAWKAGVPLWFRRNFADYAMLTVRSPARDLIRDTLLDPAARWRSHLPEARALGMLEDHLGRKRPCTEGVLLLLSLELWLQRVRL
jgi:hypothetical protein